MAVSKEFMRMVRSQTFEMQLLRGCVERLADNFPRLRELCENAAQRDDLEHMDNPTYLTLLDKTADEILEKLKGN